MCPYRKQFVLVDVLFKLGTLCQQIFVYLFLFPVFNYIFFICFLRLQSFFLPLILHSGFDTFNLLSEDRQIECTVNRRN